MDRSLESSFPIAESRIIGAAVSPEGYVPGDFTRGPVILEHPDFPDVALIARRFENEKVFGETIPKNEWLRRVPRRRHHQFARSVPLLGLNEPSATAGDTSPHIPAGTRFAGLFDEGPSGFFIALVEKGETKPTESQLATG